MLAKSVHPRLWYAVNGRYSETNSPFDWFEKAMAPLSIAAVTIM
jgi:hypothetical protein